MATKVTRVPGAGEATLRDVALAAGVSVSTASRVLAGVSGFMVKEETQERILEAARALKYRNNSVAKSLRTKKSHFIGVFLQDIENCILPRIFSGIHDSAAQHGYQVIVHCRNDGVELQHTACAWLNECRIDGMIFSSTLLMEEQVRELSNFEQPCVMLSYLPKALTDPPETNLLIPTSSAPPLENSLKTLHKSISYACADDMQGLTALVQHLKQLGHRHIALLSGFAQASPFRNRIDCFRNVMLQEGLPFEPGLVCSGGWGSWQDGSDALHRLTLRELPFTAVIGSTVNMALGALSQALRSGRRVPDDLSIVSFHDAPINEMPVISLTAVRMPLYEIGVSAVNVLHERIQNHLSPPVIVPGAELIVRESSGPVPTNGV